MAVNNPNFTLGDEEPSPPAILAVQEPNKRGAYVNDSFVPLTADEKTPYLRYNSRDPESTNQDPADIKATNPNRRHSSTNKEPSSVGHMGRSEAYTISNDDVPSSPKKEGKKDSNAPVIILVIIIVLAILIAAGVCVYIFVIKKDTEPVATVAPVAEYSHFEGIITLKDEWTDDLYNESSSLYRSISAQVEEELDIVLQESKLSTSHTLEVTQMTEGSIDVHFKLVLLESMYTTQTVLKLVQEGFVKREEESKLNIANPLEDIKLEAVPNPDKTTPEDDVTTTRDPDVAATTASVTSSSAESTASVTSSATESVTSSPTESVESTTKLPWIQTTPVRTTPASVQCEYLEVEECRKIGGFVATGFPNVFGNPTQNQAYHQLLRFTDLHKKGCYEFTMEFACSSLYPLCEEGLLIHPCRSFCEEFTTACNYPLACSMFPDDDNPNRCVLSPMHGEISTTTFAPDSNPCTGEYFRCGNNNCIPLSSRCDGIDDCEDYSDEITCGETKSSLDCDFEQDMCHYSHDAAGHFDWAIGSGSTSTYGTGPTYDHTKRTVSGKYLLSESSGRYWLDVAMVTSTLVTMETPHCLRFYFHMFGIEVASLKVILQDQNKQETVLWQRSKQQGNYWRYGDATLPVGTYTILFQAMRGRSHLGDIAIDDVTARGGACPERGCGDGEFMCSNGNCLLQEFKCDGKNDCGDFSDEQDGCVCTDEQWQCTMGMCIDGHKRCNGEYNCPDTSDELKCQCPLGQVSCLDGACVLAEWQCDREQDCAGGEDEMLCPSCTEPDDYQCLDYGCVHTDQLCNGVKDCVDGSDENGCVNQRPDAIIEVRQGKDFLPLCADAFPQSLGDSICHALGKNHVILRSTLVLQTDRYAVWTGEGDAENLLQGLSVNGSCKQQHVVTMECAEMECGSRADDLPQGFIVGGQDSSPGRWPWQVGIILNGAFTCGGSLIGKHHILTAAHCTGDSSTMFPPSSFQIILGSIKRSSEDPHRVYRRVKKIIIPDAYERDMFFWGSDVAIMAMDESVEYSDYIRPVCLPRPDEVFPLSSLCYVSGWGYTDYEIESIPDILQEGKMKLWAPSKCKNSYSYVTDSMVCAGYNSGFISNCPGDSGGPLVCQDYHKRWKQVGVFSFMSIGCNVPMKPPVFTKVQSFLPWIQDKMECAFYCDNGKCLVDSNDMCNGFDDCGDMSDETRFCVPSITCSFEERYICGYKYSSDLQYSKWEHKRSRVKHNYGPITDWSNGTIDGYYMYSGLNQAVLLAPMYNRTTEHCLKFHYHMRSSSAGIFRVFKVDASAEDENSRDADISWRMTIFEDKNDLGDYWHFGKATIEAGALVLGFEGIAQNSPSPAVAIDDVELVEGTCQEHACGPDEFQCQQYGLCIPLAQRCNFHIQCIDQSDEEDCPTLTPYTCDLENYALCGLDQRHYEDRLDWQLTRPIFGYFNGPQEDHTTGTRSGHYLHISTLNGNIGDRARISIPMHTAETEGCLHLYLNMISNGTVSVTFYTSTIYELAWQKSRYSTDGEWQMVQITLPVGVSQTVIDGVVGTDTDMATVSYIALDDITITGEACIKPTCRPNQFECDNGECIYRDHYCDGFLDCNDGSDETPELCTCSLDSFQCDSGQCLRGHVRCNRYNNCKDGSDELSCKICKPTEYQCDDQTCKSLFTWCDGVTDCIDESDEHPDCQCMEQQFQCDNKYCILGSRYCDGFVDCDDRSDEPSGCTCDERWQFRCNSTGKCIPKELRCDLNNDCGDSSDEMFCECASENLQCDNGICLEEWQLCNGEPDCPNGEDEAADCECTADQFRCASGACIPDYAVCDGIVQCYDISDEQQDCDCYFGEFQCDTGQCLSTTYQCNGRNDCGDLSDEVNCTCTANQWKCSNGLCISNNLRCNGNDDCMDESDEKGCGCREEEFQCSDGKCIPEQWLCDGNVDCAGGTDEDDICPHCDLEIAFECDDYSCVSIKSRCDGRVQCNDGSDEHGCVILSSDSGENGLVKVYHDGTFYPVCYSQASWPEKWNDQVCQMLGNGPAITVSPSPYDAPQYLKVTPGNSTLIGSHFESADTCESGEVVKLTCEHKECGRQYVSTDPVFGPSPFIVGGEYAADYKWPWMVGIYYLGVFRCGGVLIDKQWVMSAAHCFIWRNGNNLVNLPHYFTLEMGSTKLNSPTALKTMVSEIIMQPNYTSGEGGFRYSDVALLRLVEPVEENDEHRPVCLPDLPEEGVGAAATRECFVAGWGYTYRANQLETTKLISDRDSSVRGDGGGRGCEVRADATYTIPEHKACKSCWHSKEFAAPELREAKMQLWSEGRCTAESAWGELMRTETQICAGYESGYISTCFGDSGGPLMCEDWTGRWTLQGITSVGPSSCGRDNPDEPAKPNVFVRVTAYLNWIKEHMAKYR